MGNKTLYISTLKLGICSCSISDRARMPGLERTSSTIYQTRGPAWREAIVSNLTAMQRPHIRGLYRRTAGFTQTAASDLGPFGRSGLVWRAGSDISRSAEEWN
jgi:hypothetical protein